MTSYTFNSIRSNRSQRLAPDFLLVITMLCLFSCSSLAQNASLKLNENEYLEMPGLNVMLANDIYPEGHQGGVSIIQNGLRVATNGDLRLQPSPGFWDPIPKAGERKVDKANQTISVRMSYPDPTKNGEGLRVNAINYPDLNFSYTISVKPEGKSFRIVVDIDKPLPDEWIGRIGFNMELFPGNLFGKSWYLDQKSGIFHQQLNGPQYKDVQGNFQVEPMASGKMLTVVPEKDAQRMTIQSVQGGDVQLIDGRAYYNNGWFVVRSLVKAGASKNAIEWLITPNALPGWKYSPVVQVSQVGYHPDQQKVVVIELDHNDSRRLPVTLYRIGENGELEKIKEAAPSDWGDFLRYQYSQFDFSDVKKAGMYKIKYDNYETEPFQIDSAIYKRDVWQPTLEYFLPAQMCHMRVNDRERVWHGECHMDDARMAPLNTTYLDGYFQGPSTLCKFKPGEQVPGLDRGGWHDAGDYDLRVESQSGTMYGLAQAYEDFNVNYDNTTIDQINHIVEIQKPDGKPDMLQQIEHGALNVVGGYLAMDRLYRGVVEPTQRQYTLLGDPVNITDNIKYNSPELKDNTPVGLSNSPDDRWVFTEDNPARELDVAADLAGTYRVLKGFNDTLADHCLKIAEAIWNNTKETDPIQRVRLAVEMLVSTHDNKYADFLVGMTDKICAKIDSTGYLIGPSLALVNDKKYSSSIRQAIKRLRTKIDEESKLNPYGIPYNPKSMQSFLSIWGGGWSIQNFGMRQYFLHKYFPDIFPATYMLRSLDFILGRHPGSNTASFVSGVGSKSLTVAYGFNRADFSYIPGGSASGTALIQPDYPELLTWPFLWQQTEYIVGFGATDYILLVLAADHLLNNK